MENTSQIDISAVETALVKIGEEMRVRVAAAGEASGRVMEEYAKANAPWQDRTGNARRTLTGFGKWSGEDEGMFRIGVAGQMPYSPKLELGFSGRYSILQPTVEAHIPTAVNLIRDEIAKMEGISVE